jgi:hypothetical protein
MRYLVLLIVKAYVKLMDGYLWEAVEPRIRAALQDVFGFERTDLGRSTLQSEVISAIQGVEGVAYVDLAILEGLPSTITPYGLEAFLSGLKEGNPRKYIQAERARIDP